MTKDHNELAQKLNITFNNEAIFKKALVHRSYINEAKEQDLHHNERLEFLGDAVLELIVTSYLFKHYPERPEGELTSFRSAVVKTESLAETSLRLEVGEYLYMSKGEESTGGRTRPYILANAYEALLGAIYLDNGYEVAEDFVDRTLLIKMQEIVEKRLDIDNKSKLQEIAQEIFNYTPTYQVMNEEGPDHNKIFTVAVIVTNQTFGTGEGKNKQEAEQNAAQVALENWNALLQKYKN